jgi:hypothetical protein
MAESLGLQKWWAHKLNYHNISQHVIMS